jgi:hypothetical protein
MNCAKVGSDAVTIIKRSLRNLISQLAALNRLIGARVDLADFDRDCLDLVASEGPLSPSALSQKANLHLATMTGVLDRLEHGGWIVRERLEDDRRAVQISLQRGPSPQGDIATRARSFRRRARAQEGSRRKSPLAFARQFRRRSLGDAGAGRARREPDARHHQRRGAEPEAGACAIRLRRAADRQIRRLDDGSHDRLPAPFPVRHGWMASPIIRRCRRYKHCWRACRPRGPRSRRSDRVAINIYMYPNPTNDLV